MDFFGISISNHLAESQIDFTHFIDLINKIDVWV